MSEINATTAVLDAIEQVKVALLASGQPIRTDGFLDDIDRFEREYRDAAGLVVFLVPEDHEGWDYE